MRTSEIQRYAGGYSTMTAQPAGNGKGRWVHYSDHLADKAAAVEAEKLTLDVCLEQIFDRCEALCDDPQIPNKEFKSLSDIQSMAHSAIHMSTKRKLLPLKKLEAERDEARSQRDTLDNILCSIVALLGNHISSKPEVVSNGN